MANIEQLVALKARVERLQQEKDQAEGALKQSLKRLKTEFGCSSLEEGQKLLHKLHREEQQQKEAFDKALSAFEKRWGKELEDE